MRFRKGWQHEAMSIKAILRPWRQDLDFSTPGVRPTSSGDWSDQADGEGQVLGIVRAIYIAPALFYTLAPRTHADIISNFVNKQPHRLHCFYNKQSTFLHGEEGEDAVLALGQSVSWTLDLVS